MRARCAAIAESSSVTSGHAHLLRPRSKSTRSMPAPARARISCMHVLDNPVWHALTGPHATVAERVGLAARYDPDVVGVRRAPRRPDARGVGRAARARRPGRLRDPRAPRARPCPTGWTAQFTAPCRQMWLPDARSRRRRTRDERGDAIVGARRRRRPRDAGARRAHASPGRSRRARRARHVPRRPRRRRRLVAMAGERLHPPGFTEISAVCTDADYRGRGLASRLVRARRATASATGTKRRSCTSRSRTSPRTGCTRRSGSRPGRLLDVVAVQAPA